jgi:hypothetical protein
MGYRVLVTVILSVHFAYLAYVVLGGFLAWRWPRAFWPHLVAAAWGLAVVGIPLACPLTTAEDWARRRAGQAGLTQGFIDRYIEGVLYPSRYTVFLQVGVGLMVVGSWLGAYLRWRRRRPQSTDPAGPPTDISPNTGVNCEVSS